MSCWTLTYRRGCHARAIAAARSVLRDHVQAFLPTHHPTPHPTIHPGISNHPSLTANQQQRAKQESSVTSQTQHWTKSQGSQEHTGIIFEVHAGLSTKKTSKNLQGSPKIWCAQLRYKHTVLGPFTSTSHPSPKQSPQSIHILSRTAPEKQVLCNPNTRYSWHQSHWYPNGQPRTSQHNHLSPLMHQLL
jgi:hypothetical protein